GLLWQEVTCRQRFSSDVCSVLPPDLHHVIQTAHGSAFAPEDQQGTGHLLRPILGCVLEINRGTGTIILAAGVNRRRITEAAEVFGVRLWCKCARAAGRAQKP